MDFLLPHGFYFDSIIGVQELIRTATTRSFNPLLYQLSYLDMAVYKRIELLSPDRQSGIITIIRIHHWSLYWELNPALLVGSEI